MITIGEDVNLNPNIQLLKPQVYENITVFPLKSDRSYIDIISLKKGLELGLVKVKECEQSQVNTLIVENNAVTPLILIDGEEVVGGDQNRIVNSTILIGANSKMKVSVSCSEKNRWAYKSEFKQSEYIANYNTRRAKEFASRSSEKFQNVIWSSIDTLEEVNSFSSPTSAMEESYDHMKLKLNDIIDNFNVVDNQNGILIMVDGEIKGFELLFNSEIYKDFHSKILKSYLIDCNIKQTVSTVDNSVVEDIIQKALNSTFDKKDSKGLEDVYVFDNYDGLGTLYIFKNQIIHWSFFKKDENMINDEIKDNVEIKFDA